jgi:acetoacetyl-CoA synthetase
MPLLLTEPRRGDPSVVYSPPASVVAGSQLTAFRGYCERAVGQPLPDDETLYRFSVDRYDEFWRLFLEWSEVIYAGDPAPVCTNVSVEFARFFPGVELSYVENLLRTNDGKDATRPALTVCHAAGTPERISRQELRGRVLGLADALVELGVHRGDRVVSVAANNAHAVVAGLASAAVGAVFASASPHMGAPAILSRFGQLGPTLLVVGLEDEGPVSSEEMRVKLGEIARGLPSLRSIVMLDQGPAPSGTRVPVQLMPALPVATPSEPLERPWPRFPFNHPLFILFSSGTTGVPKCLVHGIGGTLLEHLKEHRLHADLGPHDKLFFHTSTAWMMWNWQLSALASGAEIVLYDGPVQDPSTLWRIVDEENVTVFGTSPPYLKLCEETGYSPRRELSLPALRTIMSTGSILYDRQYDWVRDNVGSLPVQSISGGTDIVGCFVLGSPNLPVRRGESQCRSLGLDVGSLRSPNGSGSSGVGELVCRTPFPSRPLGLYGDPTGRRFHDTYFAQNPGVWTHGDLVEITPRGSARMHGRSDGVLNAHGIRIGPAEIYRVLQSFSSISEAMAVEQRTDGGSSQSRIVLLLVMSDGRTLDPKLKGQIRSALARDASAFHVPGLIVQVDELPSTYSGKRCERVVRDLLNGVDLEDVTALRNPACLNAIREQVSREDRLALVSPRTEGGRQLTIEARLAAIWGRVLQLPRVGNDDNFFEIGGTSLLTVPLFQAIHDQLGCDLPLSTIIATPTVASMADLIREGRRDAGSSLVLLRPGSDRRPLFIAPGMSGDVLGLRGLALQLRGERAVYGLRGRGFDDGQTPWRRIEEMAEHVGNIRTIRPTGPYALAGYSLGGAVAFEIARRLRAAGESMDFLGLIDPALPWRGLSRTERLVQALARPGAWWKWIALDPIEFVRGLHRRASRLVPLGGATRFDPESPTYLSPISQANWRAFGAYRPRPQRIRAVFFEASVHYPSRPDPVPTWRRLTGCGLTVVKIPGNHAGLLRRQVSMLAEALDDSLGIAPRAALGLNSAIARQLLE